MIGRKLSHYTIEARLGKGGMGEVYQAHDSRLDQYEVTNAEFKAFVDGGGYGRREL